HHRRTERRSEHPDDRTGAGGRTQGGSCDPKLSSQGRVDAMADSSAAGRDGVRADAYAGNGGHRASRDCAHRNGRQTRPLGGRSQDYASVVALRRTGRAGLFQHRRVTRPRGRRGGGECRRARAAARAEGQPPEAIVMRSEMSDSKRSGFNLSAWAITHRPLVNYFMAVLVVIGVWSYMRLGRNEDPTFTIKAMVVQTNWPGATLDDTVLQITERIERKLQETPHLDYLKSYTRPGQSTIFVYLKGSTGPTAVSDAWYQVRKKIKDIELTLPPGVIGPVADDEFGAPSGIVYGFTADGFTHRELRDYVEAIRSRLLQVPDVAKVNLIGQQPERIYIEFSPAKLAGYGLNPAALTAALYAQNADAPSGVITTDKEGIKLRVSGATVSEKDIRDMNFVVCEPIVRVGHNSE